MKNRLINIKEEALNALSSVTDEKELNDLRVKYLGKKGVITLSLKRVGSLSSEERPEFGRQVNEVKKFWKRVLRRKRMN